MEKNDPKVGAYLDALYAKIEQSQVNFIKNHLRYYVGDNCFFCKMLTERANDE